MVRRRELCLQNGAEIEAATVVSNADVKRTFFQLVEPTYLDPHFLFQVRNIRIARHSSQNQFGARRTPEF